MSNVRRRNNLKTKYRVKNSKKINRKKKPLKKKNTKRRNNKRYLSNEQVKKLMYGGNYTKDMLDSFFTPGLTSNYNSRVSLTEETLSEDPYKKSPTRIYDMYVYDSHYTDITGTLISSKFFKVNFDDGLTQAQKKLIKFALSNREYIRDGYTIDVDIAGHKYFNLSFEFMEHIVDADVLLGKPGKPGKLFDGMIKTVAGPEVHYIAPSTHKHDWTIVLCKLYFKKVSNTTSDKKTMYDSTLYFSWSNDY